MRMPWPSLTIVAGLCCAGKFARAEEPPAATAANEATPTPARGEDYAFFESRIRPLFARHCYECHSAEADIVQGGLRLDRVDAFSRGGDGGQAVVPGVPDEKPADRRRPLRDPDFQMPPAGRLSDPEIADLVAWVERGAGFPLSTESDPAAETTEKPGIDIAAGRAFWSFQPLRRAAPPAVAHARGRPSRSRL